MKKLLQIEKEIEHVENNIEKYGADPRDVKRLAKLNKEWQERHAKLGYPEAPEPNEQLEYPEYD